MMEELTEVDRIHLAVAEMSETGSNYTGTPTKEYTHDDQNGRQIHTLNDLQLELKQRSVSQDDWATQVSQLYDDLTSTQIQLSKDDLTHKLLSIMPLTPNQARSVTELLNNNSPNKYNTNSHHHHPNNRTNWSRRRTRTTPSPLFLSPDAPSSTTSNDSNRRHRHDRRNTNSATLQSTRQPRRLVLSNPNHHHNNNNNNNNSNNNESKASSFTTTNNTSFSSYTSSSPDPSFTSNNLRHLRKRELTRGGRNHSNHFNSNNSNNFNDETILPSTPLDPNDEREALNLIRTIIKQKARRALTSYGLFSYFDGPNKTQKSTLVDFKIGLKQLGIDADYGTVEKIENVENVENVVKLCHYILDCNYRKNYF